MEQEGSSSVSGRVHCVVEAIKQEYASARRVGPTAGQPVDFSLREWLDVVKEYGTMYEFLRTLRSLMDEYSIGRSSPDGTYTISVILVKDLPAVVEKVPASFETNYQPANQTVMLEPAPA